MRIRKLKPVDRDWPQIVLHL